MVWLLYLICFVSCAIDTFINLSKGALFSSVVVKGISFIINLVIMIILAIISIIQFSWLHIFGLIATYFITGWIIGYVVIKYIYDGRID